MTNELEFRLKKSRVKMSFAIVGLETWLFSWGKTENNRQADISRKCLTRVFILKSSFDYAYL